MRVMMSMAIVAALLVEEMRLGADIVDTLGAGFSWVVMLPTDGWADRRKRVPCPRRRILPGSAEGTGNTG
jgi:hypothetical protein